MQQHVSILKACWCCFRFDMERVCVALMNITFSHLSCFSTNIAHCKCICGSFFYMHDFLSECAHCFFVVVLLFFTKVVHLTSVLHSNCNQIIVYNQYH